MAAPEHIQCFFQGLAYQSSPQNKFLWNCRLGFQEFQDYFVNAGISQGSILGPTLHHHTLMTFLMMVSVVLPLMLMILLSTVSMSNHWFYGNN